MHDPQFEELCGLGQTAVSWAICDNMQNMSTVMKWQYGITRISYSFFLRIVLGLIWIY